MTRRDEKAKIVWEIIEQAERDVVDDYAYELLMKTPIKLLREELEKYTG